MRVPTRYLFELVACLTAVVAIAATPPLAEVTSWTWTYVAPMSTPRDSLATTAGLDGRIYALGGYDADGIVQNSAEVYDASTDSWSPIAPMQMARRLFDAATGADGRIYAIGGVSPDCGDCYTTTVEAYDPGSNTWSFVAPLPDPRFWAGATTGRGGIIYVIGGDVADGFNSVRSVLIYDPVNDRWRYGPRMQIDRGNGPAAVTGLDGRIYAIGGTSWYTGGCDLSSVEVLDPSTGTWTYVASMVTPRSGECAARTAGGGIIAVGGGNNPFVWLDRTEIYIQAMDRWARSPRLQVPRRQLGLAVGSDERVYAIGGYSGTETLSSVEVLQRNIGLEP